MYPYAWWTVPAWYHVPTETEYNALISMWTAVTWNAVTAVSDWVSHFLMPLAWYSYNWTTRVEDGQKWHYQVDDIANPNKALLINTRVEVNSSSSFMADSIRCFKDTQL